MSHDSHPHHGNQSDSGSGGSGSLGDSQRNGTGAKKTEKQGDKFFSPRLHARATTNRPTSFLDLGFYLWETDGTENFLELLKRTFFTFAFLSAAAITALRPMFVDQPRAGVTEIFIASGIISLIGALKSICARVFSGMPKLSAWVRDLLDLSVPVILTLELLFLRFMMRGIFCSFCTPETISK